MNKTPETINTSHEVPIKKATFLGELLRNTLGLILNNSKIRVEGTENITKTDRPIIFVVAPHNGHTDSLYMRKAIPRTFRKKLIFLAAGDYWGKSRIDQIKANSFVRILPISREGGDESANDIQVKTVTQLQAGDHLVIFAEGTRNRIPETPIKERKFYTGIVQIIIATINTAPPDRVKANTPVVIPVYLSGTETVMPPGQALPKFREPGSLRRKKVGIRIGAPIDLLPLMSEARNITDRQEMKILLRELTEFIKGYFVAVQDNERKQLNKNPDPY